MTEDITQDAPKTVEEIFLSIQKNLPKDWAESPEDMRLHHLLKAVNEVLKPRGNWILVNGDLTLLELISTVR